MTRAVGVVGASGYAGVELLRLCASHPDLEVKVATAGTHGGEPVAAHTPSLAAAYPGLAYAPVAEAALDGLDVVFLALPHGESQHLVPDLLPQVGLVVDLAADFRLHDPGLYPRWYGEEHTVPELLDRFVYGLPELHRADLVGATAVAAPGLLPDRRHPGPGPTGAGRPGGHHRPGGGRRQRGVGGRPGPQGEPPLRDGGRGLHRLRPPRPPAHRRDGAVSGGRGPVHPPSGPDGAGDPGHLLRPPGRPGGRVRA